MIVYGKNVFKEVISSNKKIYRVILSNNFDDNNIINELNKLNIKIERLDKRELNKKYGEHNQGIVLEIEDFKYNNLTDAKDDNFIVMLDHIEDPHNLGAIIRTCEAAGVDSIIIPKKRGVMVNSTVMKVSAGALNNVKIIEVSSLAQSIDKLKKMGFWIYGTDMEGENYSKVKYDSKTCLVIGSEGFGISDLVSKKCDFIIKIPMVGKINSLNASVAAGIVIFEVLKQKTGGD